jgi:hypothetical protein
VRLAHSKARLETITNRPWLMAVVGRRTEHAGQTPLTLTALHAHFAQARAAKAAEQLHPSTVWQQVGNYLKQTLATIPLLITLPSFNIMLSESDKGHF